MLVSVVIVDDEPLILQALRRVLERSGVRVRVAHSGKDAIALVAAEVPDLLITDFSMGPGMDGVALLTELRRTHPSLRAVLHTSDPLRASSQPGAEGLEYLPKPCPQVTLTSLLESVRSSMSTKRE